MWTNEEEEKLRELVAAARESGATGPRGGLGAQAWALVAQQLGPHRSSIAAERHWVTMKTSNPPAKSSQVAKPHSTQNFKIRVANPVKPQPVKSPPKQRAPVDSATATQLVQKRLPSSREAATVPAAVNNFATYQQWQPTMATAQMIIAGGHAVVAGGMIAPPPLPMAAHVQGPLPMPHSPPRQPMTAAATPAACAHDTARVSIGTGTASSPPSGSGMAMVWRSGMTIDELQQVRCVYEPIRAHAIFAQWAVMRR